MKRNVSQADLPAQTPYRLPFPDQYTASNTRHTRPYTRQAPTLRAYASAALPTWPALTGSTAEEFPERQIQGQISQPNTFAIQRSYQTPYPYLYQANGYAYDELTQPHTSKPLDKSTETTKKRARLDIATWNAWDNEKRNEWLMLALAYNNIVSLKLEGSQWNINDIESIAEALKSNTSLNDLDMQGVEIGRDGTAFLAKALELNTGLATLDYSSNYLESEEVAALSKALKANTSLKELNLFEDSIDDKGAKVLAKALQFNTSLQRLNLEDNQITDEGVIDLAEMLKINTSLKELNLTDVFIKLEGTKALAEAIKLNIGLKLLQLERKNILADREGYILDAVIINKSLESIHAIYWDDSPCDPQYIPKTQEEKSMKQIGYRNTLWRLTEHTGIGIANLINQRYPGLGGLFPAEAGMLIAEYMLWMNSTSNPSNKRFEDIEKNLDELLAGISWKGQH